MIKKYILRSLEVLQREGLAKLIAKSLGVLQNKINNRRRLLASNLPEKLNSFLDTPTSPNSWDKITFVDRVHLLANTKNKKLVVYIYEQPDYSTFRYRVYNMCQVLNKTSTFSATYFFVNELKLIEQYIDFINFIVFVRIRWSAEIDKFLNLLKKDSKKYFDIDDLVYDMNKIPLVIDALGADTQESTYNYWFSYAPRLVLTANYCDEFITTNKFLESKVAGYFKKKTHVMPNFINDEQMKLSDLIWQEKQEKRGNLKILEGENPIVLGYFSGTATHNKDFESINSELYGLMLSNNINLKIVGYLDLPEIFTKFIEQKRIEFLPIQYHLNLQKKIADCDVNLVPLAINEFTNCKSEIKYFEAAIVGVPTVAASTFIYRQIIKNGFNGYIAQKGEWKKQIERALSDRGNVVATARKYAKNNYYGINISKKLQAIFS